MCAVTLHALMEHRTHSALCRGEGSWSAVFVSQEFLLQGVPFVRSQFHCNASQYSQNLRPAGASALGGIHYSTSSALLCELGQPAHLFLLILFQCAVPRSVE